MVEISDLILCIASMLFIQHVITFSHSDGLDELMMLSLQETYSLPVLMYAAPALTLSNKQVAEL